ncbi:MAG: Dyp-type peroxidase [Actinomycetota bacterium]|nr:Dyp-type peroxidase [Actinomycetota bacterium]
MGLPQSGIFALGTSAHSVVELELIDPDAAPSCLAAIARFALELNTTNGVNLVVGIRPSLFMRLTDIPVMAEDFSSPIEGPEAFSMPATQADIWLWFAAGSQDRAFDCTRKALSLVSGIAKTVRATTGWTYQGNRDLTGFIDGTENPPAAEASAVALIGEPARLAGSSIALVQRWRHDLDSFSSLGTAEQERVFGRTKPDSVEFDEDRMPADAHVARTSLKVGSESLPIYRRSMPYGDAADHGLLFIAFTHDQGRIALMLASMAGETDGVRDALTHFSTPESGAYYFVPSFELLEEIAAGS